MTALITTLIATPDNSEVVRDRIAEILLTEQAAQQALAEAADEDPDQWRLRVFTERSNPWEEFLAVDAPDEDEPAFAPPIVNVWVESINYDPRTSDVVKRQKAVATYNIDCYGYGVSAEGAVSGHDPGDARASMEAQRAVRLVRNIMMAAAYTYLGLPRGASQFVWKRWLQSVTMFQPTMDGRPVAHVAAARMSFQIDFNEFSPQVEGDVGQVVTVTIRRAETGEVFFVAEYQEPEVAFPTQHFNIGKIGSPAVADTPGTPDVSALAVFSQMSIASDRTIAAIHLHGIEDKGSGTMTVEIFRRRDGDMESLGTATLTGGAGDFATATLTPDETDLVAGDYLFAQLTAFSGAGGYDGITVDVHCT